MTGTILPFTGVTRTYAPGHQPSAPPIIDRDPGDETEHSAGPGNLIVIGLAGLKGCDQPQSSDAETIRNPICE